MEPPPEHRLDFGKIPIWLNFRRTRFLIRFRHLLKEYYALHPKTWRQRYRKTSLYRRIEEQKLLAESFVVLGPHPGFGGAFRNAHSGEQVELFKEAVSLDRYVTGLQVVLERIDQTVEFYRKDRPQAFRRTLNPSRMLRWVYSSMGEMPEWHLRYWIWSMLAYLFRRGRDFLAVLAIVAMLMDFCSGAFGIGSFLGYRETLIHAGHRFARWIHVENRRSTGKKNPATVSH